MTIMYDNFHSKQEEQDIDWSTHEPSQKISFFTVCSQNVLNSTTYCDWSELCQSWLPIIHVVPGRWKWVSYIWTIRVLSYQHTLITTRSSIIISLRHIKIIVFEVSEWIYDEHMNVFVHGKNVTLMLHLSSKRQQCILVSVLLCLQFHSSWMTCWWFLSTPVFASCHHCLLLAIPMTVSLSVTICVGGWGCPISLITIIILVW